MASFAIAVRIHGEDGEGSALAAIVSFRVSRKGRDIASTFENFFVVLARAKNFTYYLCFA